MVFRFLKFLLIVFFVTHIAGCGYMLNAQLQKVPDPALILLQSFGACFALCWGCVVGSCDWIGWLRVLRQLCAAMRDPFASSASARAQNEEGSWGEHTWPTRLADKYPQVADDPNTANLYLVCMCVPAPPHAACAVLLDVHVCSPVVR